jgi:hypothetical protein
MSKTILFLCSINIFVFSLSQFLLNSSIDKDIEAYLYEAKCQLLMYSAIGMIKMNMIVRRKSNRVGFLRFNFRDVDRYMMRKWLVQQCVYYYFNKVNPMKIPRSSVNIHPVFVQCVFDI